MSMKNYTRLNPGARLIDGDHVSGAHRGQDVFVNFDDFSASLEAFEATLATTAGVGITAGTGTLVKTSVKRDGDLVTTKILLDLTGLNSSAGVDDIIGVDGVGVAHLGQITAARNGTLLGGTMTCLEAPATGDVDINLYSAVEATGVEDTAISALDETLLLNGGTHTLGLVGPLAAVPAADEYLYLTGGGTTAATYTAGRFLIELVGYA